MKKHLLILLAFLCLAPAQIFAAGYFYLESGPVATGRAGAYTATADTPYAVIYNPAGLAQSHGFQFTIACDTAFTLTDYSVKYNGSIPEAYTSADIADINPLDLQYQSGKTEKKESSTIDPIPTLFLSYGFEDIKAGSANLGDLTVLIGGFWYTRRAVKDYESGGFVDYTGTYIETSSYSIAAPSVAWKFCDYVSVGGTFELIYYGTKLSRAVSAYLPSLAGHSILMGNGTVNDPFSEQWKVYTEIEVNKLFIPCWNAGIMITPFDGLSIGAMYHDSYHVDAEGTFSIEEKGFFDPDHPLNLVAKDKDRPFLEMTGEKIQWITDVAGIFRSGIKYQFTERFDLEFNFGIEFWNVHKTIRVEYKDIELTINSKVPPNSFIEEGYDEETSTLALSDIEVVKNYKNSYTFALGSDIKLVPELWTMRLGVQYQTGAVPEDQLDSLAVDNGMISGAIGSTVSVGIVDIDLACQYNHAPEMKTTEDSKVSVTNILDDQAILSPGDVAISMNQVNLTLGARVKI